jgi:hypothetical protein
MFSLSTVWQEGNRSFKYWQTFKAGLGLYDPYKERNEEGLARICYS